MSPPRQEAAPDELREPQNDSVASGLIRFNENVDMILERGTFASGDIEVCGLMWGVVAKRNRKDSSCHLGIYLHHLTYETRPWSVDVSAQFKLVGFGDRNREWELKKTFHNGCTRAGIDEFIPW
ncbi:hypothetical protein PMAYCL1PPCAC_05349 [Pristionchus mayeri]|uniref:MATH domain-containing protein n=1 Tax=Pristionchus mayeri TaxID=1317129 RepID=A0AAN4Z860_9BILA|nr:hypothetical protein PMAYCL1PPCAC_05349 [Pristionchus mayeri]